eukprot:scaffold11212_cov121-Cylindrotheca_fusiformis.AAC.10
MIVFFIAVFGDDQNPNLASSPFRILCFGDSLTAGAYPPKFRNFQYAPHLENALLLNNSDQLPKPGIAVWHKGFPGWTSRKLLERANGQDGLGTLIHKIKNPSLSLVILLAGTNDLGQTQSASEIADSVISLHQFCFNQNVPMTIAIGIPPSKFIYTLYPDLAEKLGQINAKLEGC